MRTNQIKSGLSGMQLVTLEGLDGMQLVTLEGLHNKNLSGMQLVTLEDDFSNQISGLSNPYIELLESYRNQNEIPHYTILKDPKIWTALFQTWKTLVVRDKHSNTFIVGFVQKGAASQQHFKHLLQSGVFFAGMDAGAVKASRFYREYEREHTGSGWTIDEGNRQAMGIANTALHRMKVVEDEGRGYKEPHVFAITDKETIGWKDVGKIIVPVFGLMQLVLPGVGTVIAGIAKSLMSAINAVNSPGGLNPIALSGAIVEGMSYLGANDGTLKTISETAQDITPYIERTKEYYNTGKNIYGIYQSPNPTQQKISEVLKLQNSSLFNELDKYLAIGANDKASDILKKPLAEVEKIYQSIQFAEMSRIATMETRAFMDGLPNKNAFGDKTVQQFFTAIGSTIEDNISENLVTDNVNGVKGDISVMPGIVPNSTAILRGIIQENGLDLSQTELKTLIDVAQGTKAHTENLEGLVNTAMIEKARTLTRQGEIFVIPSTLSQKQQRYLLDRIPAEVRQARVKTLHPKIKFYKEFV